jgi:hypothetical protein
MSVDPYEGRGNDAGAVREAVRLYPGGPRRCNTGCVLTRPREPVPSPASALGSAGDGPGSIAVACNKLQKPVKSQSRGVCVCVMCACNAIHA